MFIFLVISIVLIAAAIGAAIYNSVESYDGKIGLGPFIMGGVALVFLTLFICSTKVDSAEVGIKFKKFSVNEQGDVDAAKCSGVVFYNPFTTDIFTYPTKVLEADYEEFSVTTKDGARFGMDPYISFYIDKGLAVDIFKTYRDDIWSITSKFMKTAVYDAFRLVANKYTSDGLMENREKFESEVDAILEKTLSSEGFIVKQFTTKIEPPASLRSMIDSKNEARQATLKAENEIAKAEAEARIKIAKADGEAKAMRIKADAEAYYNRTISASLSQMIVQEDWIEKWNGEMPSVMGGSNSMPMMINLK